MKKKVLVVDDEKDILDLLKYNLVKEGFDVQTASNGADALQKAAAKPDLVILDLMMPVLDGFETCKRLKASPETASIPVVFLTAKSGEVDEILG
ncbi:response regulator transcription factor, partial [bacterium]|nr:response regulator transcription factor [bacterium]